MAFATNGISIKGRRGSFVLVVRADCECYIKEKSHEFALNVKTPQ